MNARWAGLAVVAVLAWNAAFVAAQRFGIFLSVGVVALVVVVRSAAVPLDWRALFAPRRAALIVGFVAAGALVGATALLRDPLLRASPELERLTRALYDLFGTATFVQGYLLLPLIAAAEEIVWRGAVQFGFEARLGRWGAVVAAAVLYACGHIAAHNPLLLGLALAMGVLWGSLRAGTRSLWPGIISHVLWDLFVVVWAPLPQPQYNLFRL